MKELSMEKLTRVNGGGVFMDTYKDIRDFVNKNLRDLIKGIKAGWKSK